MLLETSTHYFLPLTIIRSDFSHKTGGDNMSSQVQCPNCGGYKATSAKLMQQSPVSSSQRIRNIIIYLVLLGLSIVGVIFFPGLGRSICGFSAVVFLVVFLTYLFRSNITIARVVPNAYQFTCTICGYRWEWREGQPWPDVHVRPDLIVKGEQRLEEERLRQQDPRIRQ